MKLHPLIFFMFCTALASDKKQSKIIILTFLDKTNVTGEM